MSTAMKVYIPAAILVFICFFVSWFAVLQPAPSEEGEALSIAFSGRELAYYAPFVWVVLIAAIVSLLVALVSRVTPPLPRGIVVLLLGIANLAVTISQWIGFINLASTVGATVGTRFGLWGILVGSVATVVGGGLELLTPVEEFQGEPLWRMRLQLLREGLYNADLKMFLYVPAAIFALVCFFIPWFDVSNTILSGSQVAKGVQRLAVLGVEAAPVGWVILIATILIIPVAFLAWHGALGRLRGGVFLIAAAAGIFFLFNQISTLQRLEKATFLGTRFGVWGTFVGLIVIIVAGALDLIFPADAHQAEMLRIRLGLTWKSFRKNWGLYAENRIGLFGLGVIVFFFLVLVAHPILMITVWEPKIYDPVTGYDKIMKEVTVVEGEVEDPMTQVNVDIARIDYDPMAEVGDVLEVLVQPAPPSPKHLLGTDPLGRDVLSQLMYSTASEFALGIVAAIVTVTIATTIGAVSAYFGGLVDTLFMRLADLIIILPFIAILIVLGALFNLGLIHLALLFGILSGFGGTTLIIKSQALTIKVKPFIEAAKVAGGSNWHIIFTHIVPNLMPLAFLYMMFTVTSAIFSEAVLSFFGLMNINMSWGIMIQLAQNQGYLLSGTRYWWLLMPAGIAISLLCTAFYLVGRALDEVVNPRLRKR